MSGHRRAGFSLAELMVVVGIVALLMGLLLPALGKARARARKAHELNDLRLVGMAWTVYANQSNDKILPGYLTTRTQQHWRVNYRYADGSIIPPAPDYPAEEYPGGPPNVAGPWPWRLMPFLDHQESVLLEYRADLDSEILDRRERAWEIRNHPAFGYNGLFFGGWWADARRPWYDAARVVADATADSGTGDPVRVVSRSLGGVRRSAEVIIFASAAERNAGLYKYDPRRDDRDGTHMVLPPIVTRHELWGLPNLRNEDEIAGGGGSDAPTAVGTQLTGVVEALHVYGNDTWGGNPFEHG
ncbi:MAG: type II secretion system protein [Planctomycetota bacterium]|jgi:prepilin-type N-terminal cleavage/methylation domain-containing protein